MNRVNEIPEIKQENIVEKEVGRLFDERQLLSAIQKCIDPDAFKKRLQFPWEINPTQANRDLEEMIERYTFAWQSASSGTVGNVVTRLEGLSFLKKIPEFEVLREPDEPLLDGESHDWKHYLTISHQQGKYRIKARVIFPAQTSDSLNNTGLRNPYQLMNEWKKDETQNVAANWDFLLSRHSLRERINDIEQKKLSYNKK